MTDEFRIGLDLHSDQVLVAKVSHLLGRPEIVSLSAIDSPRVAETIGPDTKPVISMPDDEALVKTIHLPENRSQTLRDRVFFELAQSILEPEERFRFACIETGNRHQIGLIFRNDLIAARARRIGLPLPDFHILPSADLRSVALAHAYKYFCKSEPGDLIALALVTANLVSIALLYHGRIVALGNSSIGASSQSEGSFKTVAIALKTLINFKLAALHDDGITIPLSALLVLGDKIGESERAVLQSFFSARVAPCSPDQVVEESVSRSGLDNSSRFLIPLGLTVN
ncbi:MAG: hypothetical protein WAU88_04290 [Candidatus Zixiibacteriota bacterium]